MNKINEKRTLAVQFRKLGKSYKEISDELKVAKSTLSYWLKDIQLSPQHRERLYTKQINILSKGPKSQKERRANEVDLLINRSQNEVTLPISEDVYKYLGVALYWAEGSKSKIMQFTNSDPYLILFMIKWLNKIFNISPINLKANLNIYSQQNEKDIINYWSDLTGIPMSNFGKSFIKPASKVYKKNNLYYGTIKIYVPKSTNFKYRMLGWLKALLQDLNIDVELTQKKWVILKNTSNAINLNNI